MTDTIPPITPPTKDPVTDPKKARSSGNARISPWRVAWMGIGLAVVLWFGSTAYFQKMHRFAEIEYQTGNMTEADYSSLTLDHARYSMACKVGAGVLLLASLLYLVNRIDIRQSRHRPDNG